MAHQKIEQFFEQLDALGTPLEIREQIICKDYLTVYHYEYVPVLAELSSEYTLDELKSDLDKALNYYKEKYNVTC